MEYLFLEYSTIFALMKYWYESFLHPEYDAILKKIVKIRKEKGFSQSFMASKLSMLQPGYAKIEKGITKLDIVRFIAILKILDVSYLEFFKDIENSVNEQSFKN